MAEHEQGAERWRWEKTTGVWLVYNDKSEGFIANSERSAIIACHYLNTLEDDLAALRQQLADATKYGEIRNRQWQDTQANYYELQQTLRDVRQQLADADADAERLAGLLRVTLKGESEPPWTATSFDALARHDTLASPSRDTGSEEGKG